MTETEYEIVMPLPVVTYKYAIGQDVYVLHEARAVKTPIHGVNISLEEGKKQIVYILGELGVGRKEEDIWDSKASLVHDIFEL